MEYVLRYIRLHWIIYAPIYGLCLMISSIEAKYQIHLGESIISPIHKSGSFDVPGNFRGISLINMLCKIFIMGSKKISNDQELIQSDPISCPQNQKGNNQIHN